MILTSAVILCPTFGNIGGYAKGVASTGAFKPFGIGKVEMLSERLEINLHIEYAEISIEYVLHNPGPKITVEAGFPATVSVGPFGRDFNAPLASHIGLENFQLNADGVPIETSLIQDDLRLSGDDLAARIAQGACIKGWHIFKLDFKKGQSRRLIVRYRNPYSVVVQDGAGGFFSSSPSLSYIFSSAAAWSGPIKQGSVIIRAISIDPELVEFSHPRRFKKEGRTWTWLFTDLEPTLEDDLSIVVFPGRHSPSTEGLLSSDEELSKKASYVHWDRSTTAGGDRWELHSKDFVVTASSTLPSEGSNSYAAENLADYSKDTSWVEGAPGSGVGESVTLTLPKPAKISKVGLVNGYAKDQQHYEANNRVARLEVSLDGGKSFQVDIPDERLSSEQFYFDLPAPSAPVTTVKLTIVAVHKGTKYADTALSDVILVSPLKKEPKIRAAR